MEKCNYCLQRISRARKTAEKENRTIKEEQDRVRQRST